MAAIWESSDPDAGLALRACAAACLTHVLRKNATALFLAMCTVAI